MHRNIDETLMGRVQWVQMCIVHSQLCYERAMAELPFLIKSQSIFVHAKLKLWYALALYVPRAGCEESWKDDVYDKTAVQWECECHAPNEYLIVENAKAMWNVEHFA